MEKRTPHNDLSFIQRQVASLAVAAFTKTALDGGRQMGLTTAEMLAVIGSLTRQNFYKSMTTHAATGFGRTYTMRTPRQGEQPTSK